MVNFYAEKFLWTNSLQIRAQHAYTLVLEVETSNVMLLLTTLTKVNVAYYLKYYCINYHDIYNSHYRIINRMYPQIET